ncbi:hypothetical protein GCM10023342_28950 [Modicisalibacter zincidurans]|uniref:Uncharacterized protein n=1 Tax=Modicisalibacter zincidurans TaxID=1178777 RepID=A0ABP9RJX2_9GAMM
MAVEAVDAGDLKALPDDRETGMAGEGAATGAEFDVGHAMVRVNGDNGYIAMQVSGLEGFQGTGFMDSGDSQGDLDGLLNFHRRSAWLSS